MFGSHQCQPPAQQGPLTGTAAGTVKVGVRSIITDLGMGFFDLFVGFLVLGDGGFFGGEGVVWLFFSLSLSETITCSLGFRTSHSG